MDLVRFNPRILITISILFCSVFSKGGEDTWIEVKSPNFTIVSNASAIQARRVANSLERFRAVFQSALPKYKVDSGSPLVVFVVQGREDIKALVSNRPEQNTEPPMGTFLASPERQFIVVRLDLSRSSENHAIYHEYAHVILRQNFRNLPTWLSEGLAEVFGSASVSDRSSIIGKPDPEFFRILSSSPMIPLVTLLSAGPDSPFYLRQGLNEIFYAQSWALAHYLMLGDHGAHVPQLDAYLQLVQNEGLEREAAERAFGDIPELQRKLEKYLRVRNFSGFASKARISAEEVSYPVRALAPGEALTYRGWLLTNTNRLQEAGAVLEQALRLEPKNASANEAMGWLYLRLKNPAEAKKYFSAAAQLNSTSFLARYYTAELEYERQGDYVLAEELLRNVLTVKPDFIPAREVLAYILTTQETKLPEALKLATETASLEPDQPKHRVLVGRILLEMGRDEEARTLAERLLSESLTQDQRREAELLLSRLRQRRQEAIDRNRRLEILQEQLQKIEDQRRRDKELEVKIRAEAAMRKLNAEAGKIKLGPPARVIGSIRSVRCSEPAVIDIVLEGRDKQSYRLHAQNYYKIQYWSLGSGGMIGFRPCVDLDGKGAIIRFRGVSGQGYSGIIQSIEFTK